MYLNTSDKTHCYGCGVCASICPRGCITMTEDAEGFRYPVIDREKCVSCGLCERACPYSAEKPAATDARAFVGFYQDESVLRSSASGGAFTALYNHVLEQGGAVFGVKFDENMQVVHDSADTAQGCEAFRTSKYVLSRCEHSYEQVASRLRAGQRVLFTGTPCQCAALKNYLLLRRVADDGLITADLVCHGAPNQKIFDDYLAELFRNQGSRVKRYRFRYKDEIDGAVNSRRARIDFESGEMRCVTSANDAFLRGYYRRLFYRPSCAACRFAQVNRASDVTIADAWGVGSLYPEWNVHKGVSLVLLNSEKGKTLLPALEKCMELRPVTPEWAEQNNNQLHEPTKMHPKRDVFFRLWPKKGMHAAVAASTRDPLLRRVIRKAKKIARRLLKR